MAQLDKKLINIFARAIMPELYENQAAIDKWADAIQNLVGKEYPGNNNSPLEGHEIKGENQDAKEQQST